MTIEAVPKELMPSLQRFQDELEGTHRALKDVRDMGTGEERATAYLAASAHLAAAKLALAAVAAEAQRLAAADQLSIGVAEHFQVMANGDVFAGAEREIAELRELYATASGSVGNA